MLQARAYMHHYEKYGVGVGQMQEAMIVCEETLLYY
jgi:hypothetical protein